MKRPASRRSDQRVAEAEARKAEDEVILAVHQLYYSLLIASMKQKDASQGGIERQAEEGLREARKRGSRQKSARRECNGVPGRACCRASRRS